MNPALFSRNLKRYGQSITLQNRDIQPPDFGSSDYDEDFTNDRVVLGIINTSRGKTMFDGVSNNRLVTQIIFIAFIPNITAETWVLFKGRRFDVLDVENCCERDDVLKLSCSERGIGNAAKS